MRNIWGQSVYILRTQHRITRVRLSTVRHYFTAITTPMGAQLVLIHKLTPTRPHHISPANFALPPLIEHYLYPVSTEPITTATKGKLKKGN